MLEFCKSGLEQGNGWDSVNSCWIETCGNYNWSAEIGGGSAPDWDEPTTVGGNSWTIECTGDGTATGSTVEQLACLTAGENMTAYAMADAMLAQSKTCHGGTVWFPSGTYMNAGCGQDIDGNPNNCPVLATYPNHLQRRVQSLRNIKWIGAGSQRTDPAAYGRDTTKTIWVSDHGLASANGSEFDRDDSGARLWGWSHSTGRAERPNTCITEDITLPAVCEMYPDVTENDSRGKVGYGIYGTVGAIIGTMDADAGDNRVCLNDTVATYGTCAGNRQIRCTTEGTLSRVGQGGVTGDCGDYGPCDGTASAIEYDIETLGKQIHFVSSINNCDFGDINTKSTCGGGLAIYGRVTDVGGSCESGTGRYVLIQQPESTTRDLWPWPVFEYDADTYRGFFMPIELGEYMHYDGGYTNMTFMAANWTGRDSANDDADCESSILSDTIASTEEGTPADGLVEITSTSAHNRTLGDLVDISGTTSYNRSTRITDIIDADTFEIEETWVADETGAWAVGDGHRAGCDTTEMTSNSMAIGGGYDSISVLRSGGGDAFSVMDGRSHGDIEQYVKDSFIAWNRELLTDSGDVTMSGNTWAYNDCLSRHCIGTGFSPGAVMRNETVIGNTGPSMVGISLGRGTLIQDIRFMQNTVQTGLFSHTATGNVEIDGVRGWGNRGPVIIYIPDDEWTIWSSSIKNVSLTAHDFTPVLNGSARAAIQFSDSDGHPPRDEGDLKWLTVENFSIDTGSTQSALVHFGGGIGDESDSDNGGCVDLYDEAADPQTTGTWDGLCDIDREADLARRLDDYRNKMSFSNMTLNVFGGWQGQFTSCAFILGNFAQATDACSETLGNIWEAEGGLPSWTNIEIEGIKIPDHPLRTVPMSETQDCGDLGLGATVEVHDAPADGICLDSDNDGQMSDETGFGKAPDQNRAQCWCDPTGNAGSGKWYSAYPPPPVVWKDTFDRGGLQTDIVTGCDSEGFNDDCGYVALEGDSFNVEATDDMDNTAATNGFYVSDAPLGTLKQYASWQYISAGVGGVNAGISIRGTGTKAVGACHYTLMIFGAETYRTHTCSDGFGNLTDQCWSGEEFHTFTQGSEFPVIAANDTMGFSVDDGVGDEEVFTVWHWNADEAPDDFSDWEGSANVTSQTLCAVGGAPDGGNCDVTWDAVPSSTNPDCASGATGYHVGFGSFGNAMTWDNIRFGDTGE